MYDMLQASDNQQDTKWKGGAISLLTLKKAVK